MKILIATMLAVSLFNGCSSESINQQGQSDTNSSELNHFRLIKPAEVTLMINKKVYIPHEKITITLVEVTGESNNWVGIFKKDAENTWDNDLQDNWFYFREGSVQMTAPNVPGEYEIRLFYNDSLHLEKKVSFIVKDGEDAQAQKKIFLIGDSTVHNTTTYDNQQVRYGWGDLLSKYMVNAQNLYNLAEPGQSSLSYKDRSDLEGDGWFHNWYQTKNLIENSDIQNGGYLFIQFGHNDETDENYDDGLHTLPGRGDTFYNNLKEYIDYARQVGLEPVLITSVERMMKEEGAQTVRSHIRNSGDYVQTVKDLADDEHVLLLDLEQSSWELFNQYKDTNALIDIFGYNDVEHFSYDGANTIANLVKELICNSEDRELCKQFK